VLEQPRMHGLMAVRRRGAHDVHTVEQLVAQAVVRQREQLVDGRDRLGHGWHTHNLSLLGRGEQDIVAEDTAVVTVRARSVHSDGCECTRCEE
jgi:hypothetical protein